MVTAALTRERSIRLARQPQLMGEAFFDLADCRGSGWELFFPEPVQGANIWAQQCFASDFCHGCPVRTECIEYSLEFNPKQLGGFWGGLSPEDRRLIHQVRPQATSRYFLSSNRDRFGEHRLGWVSRFGTGGQIESGILADGSGADPGQELAGLLLADYPGDDG